MQPFEDFVKTLSPDYPLNGIAQAYMQDWYDGRPIDGGVAYETQLRSIILDGSLDSLATLDKFLDAVKPRLATDAIVLSQTTVQRNLLTFIGFYAGLVFCYQAQQSAYWVSFAHLTTAFPPLLKVINDDFSYSMAVSIRPIATDSQPFMPMVLNETTFFPLVAIIERLYPVRNPSLPSPTHAPFFGFITDSLFTSVEKLLQTLQSPQAVTDNHKISETITPISKPLIHQNFDQHPTVEPSSDLLQPLEEPNRIRFNPFRNHKLFYLSDNPFLTLKSQQLTSDEALYEPFGHPFIAPVSIASVSSPNPTLQTDLIPTPTPITSSQPVLDGQHLAEYLSINPLPATNEKVSDMSETAPISTSKTLALQAREDRKKPTTSDIKQLQKNQKDLAKAQKTRQDALKKSLAEKAEQKRQQEIAEALANPRIYEGLLHQSHSMLAIAERQAQQKDSFSELEADLNNSELITLVGQNNPKLFAPLQHGKSLDEMYHKAKQVLDNFNQLIQTHSQQQAKNQTQNQPQQDFQFTPQQQNTVAQAVAIIEKTAKAEHTDAMLWLALNEFRGDTVFGISQNSETAIQWVNQAANLGDSRAEKLLSKLYYRGEVVPMDTDLGNYWLELAAEHGHPEAKNISQQMAIAKVLKDTQKDESNYVRYLLWGIAVLVTLAFVAVAFIKV